MSERRAQFGSAPTEVSKRAEMVVKIIDACQYTTLPIGIAAMRLVRDLLAEAHKAADDSILDLLKQEAAKADEASLS